MRNGADYETFMDYLSIGISTEEPSEINKNASITPNIIELCDCLNENESMTMKHTTLTKDGYCLLCEHATFHMDLSKEVGSYKNLSIEELETVVRINSLPKTTEERFHKIRYQLGATVADRAKVALELINEKECDESACIKAFRVRNIGRLKTYLHTLGINFKELHDNKYGKTGRRKTPSYLDLSSEGDTPTQIFNKVKGRMISNRVQLYELVLREHKYNEKACTKAFGVGSFELLDSKLRKCGISFSKNRKLFLGKA